MSDFERCVLIHSRIKAAHLKIEINGAGMSRLCFCTLILDGNEIIQADVGRNSVHQMDSTIDSRSILIDLGLDIKKTAAASLVDCSEVLHPTETFSIGPRLLSRE